MVRVSRVLLKDAGLAIDKTLSEILVCPLSKQPLRFLISLLSICILFVSQIRSVPRRNCLSNLTNCDIDRVCEKTKSLVSDTIGVSFPVSFYSNFNDFNPKRFEYFRFQMSLIIAKMLVWSWALHESYNVWLLLTHQAGKLLQITIVYAFGIISHNLWRIVKSEIEIYIELDSFLFYICFILNKVKKGICSWCRFGILLIE